MKKLIAIMMLLALCLGCTAFADEPDFTGMTSDEIARLVSAGKAELDRRAAATPEKNIFTAEGLTIAFDKCNLGYVIGTKEPKAFQVYLAVINDTAYPVELTLNGVEINGWTATSYINRRTSEIVASGIRTRDVYISTADTSRAAGITSYDELLTYSLHLTISQETAQGTKSTELIVDCAFNPKTGMTITNIESVN